MSIKKKKTVETAVVVCLMMVAALIGIIWANAGPIERSDGLDPASLTGGVRNKSAEIDILYTVQQRAVLHAMKRNADDNVEFLDEKYTLAEMLNDHGIVGNIAHVLVQTNAPAWDVQLQLMGGGQLLREDYDPSEESSAIEIGGTQPDLSACPHIPNPDFVDAWTTPTVPPTIVDPACEGTPGIPGRKGVPLRCDLGSGLTPCRLQLAAGVIKANLPLSGTGALAFTNLLGGTMTTTAAAPASDVANVEMYAPLMFTDGKTSFAYYIGGAYRSIFDADWAGAKSTVEIDSATNADMGGVTTGWAGATETDWNGERPALSYYGVDAFGDIEIGDSIGTGAVGGSGWSNGSGGWVPDPFAIIEGEPALVTIANKIVEEGFPLVTHGYDLAMQTIPAYGGATFNPYLNGPDLTMIFFINGKLNLTDPTHKLAGNRSGVYRETMLVNLVAAY